MSNGAGIRGSSCAKKRYHVAFVPERFLADGLRPRRRGLLGLECHLRPPKARYVEIYSGEPSLQLLLTSLFQMNPAWFVYTSAMLTTVGILKHSPITRFGVSAPAPSQYGVKSLGWDKARRQQKTHRKDENDALQGKDADCMPHWQARNQNILAFMTIETGRCM